MKYMLDKTVMVLRLLDASETITKTAYVRCSRVCLLELTKGNREFARVFGVDWFSVISRGSQFKVESFMFRIAKSESLVLLSPSKDDVGPTAPLTPRIIYPTSSWFRLEDRTPQNACR